MKIMLRLAALVLAALSLSACVSLKEPIGTSVGYKNDPALEGLWAGRTVENKDKGITFVHVLPNDDDTMTAVAVTPRHGDDKASWGTLELTTAKLGENRYLNERETGDDGKPKDEKESTPALYRVTGDMLIVSTFNTDRVAKEVDAGRIAGIVHRNDQDHSVESVEVTADGPALDAWLAGADAPKLFDKFLVLKRMTAPE